MSVKRFVHVEHWQPVFIVHQEESEGRPIELTEKEHSDLLWLQEQWFKWQHKLAERAGIAYNSDELEWSI